MMHLKNMVRGMENDTVARQFIRHWEHDPQTLKFWRASSNFVYTFERDGVRQFLRFIHEEDNAIDRIQSELDFMLYLIEHGYPTVSPIRSADGNWIEAVQSEEDGRYYGVVFEQTRGSDVSLDQMTDRQAEAWGAALGCLHRLSESYMPGETRRGSWQDALTFISSILDRHPREVGARQELARLRERFSALPAGVGKVGLIHYDFETDNVFYEAEGSRFYAIDFDDAMYHWYAMDVASAISDLMEEDDTVAKRKIAHFLTGYRSIKTLDEDEVRQFALFQKFADLYRFARIVRSVEEFDASGSPAWAIALNDKLLGINERIRSNYRPIRSWRS
ncbi:phosphotransferase enzyme family protein [Cohnella sp. GbtcB17]|uniref:phosphotransferase enzyme family protein n=1 Tax=Cohnella sp. GbtcB17 TaxID=2824762 RepID=UPI001C2F8BEC|nr:phosphotransferase [Cohnella sp. GbtcB17]